MNEVVRNLFDKGWKIETSLEIAEMWSIESFMDFLEYAGVKVIEILELEPEDGWPEEILFNWRLMPVEYAFLRLNIHKEQLKNILSESTCYSHYVDQL